MMSTPIGDEGIAKDLRSNVKEFGEKGLRAPSSPALHERLAIVEDWLSGRKPRSIRTVSAPIYVTDLGVRHIEDPELFYRAHCNLFKISPIRPENISSTLRHEELPRLALAIDASILFFGDYETVGASIKSRSQEIAQFKDYELLIHAGVIMAALGEPESVRLFDMAANVATNDSDAYAAHHRAAAFLLPP